LWRDTRRIDSGDQSEPVVEEAIVASFLFVVVLSRNWLARPSCLRELDLFRNRWRDEDEATVRQRIVIIAKHPTPREELPPLLRGQEGYRFFDIEPGGKVHEFFARGRIVDARYMERIAEVARRFSRIAAQLQATSSAMQPVDVTQLATAEPLIAGFFDDLLEDIEEGRVISIIGEELLEVVDEGTVVPLYGYISRRLAEQLDILPGQRSGGSVLNEVTEQFMRSGGVPEEIYPKIRRIVSQAQFQPPLPLLQLAEISSFNLFVSLTFDSLLAEAIDRVRFQGNHHTQQFSFNIKDPQDLPAPYEDLNQPIVYHLFGKMSAQPDYVVTEEDKLEFLTALQSGRVPEFLFDALRDSHLLFLGCSLPGWMMRLLLRITRGQSLSRRRSVVEVLVGKNADQERELVTFVRHFSPRTKMISYPAAEFISELEARYRARSLPRRLPEADDPAMPAEMEKGAIFISYAREDAAAARRLGDFLKDEAGIDIWLDTSASQSGKEWDLKIRRNIRDCSYFVPLISRNAVNRREGFFRLEWRLAAERAMRFSEETPFILPVAIDDTGLEAEGLPERFRQVQWIQLPGGNGNEGFRRQMIELTRSYRRRTRDL
jgi:hypothetical protein